MIPTFKYIYGPIYSWRLGRSLGVDPLSAQHKICNMNCVYCQLGKTAELTHQRKAYVPTDDLLKEISTMPQSFIDYITFSGRGEPTLAKNLGEMIRGVKEIRREKVAVITNSLLLGSPDVQEDLAEADFVLAKIDAANQEMLDSIDGVSKVDYGALIRGLSQFRQQYKGKFALQIMLIKDNFDYLKQLGALALLLKPHEVQLNTPLRACGQLPLGRDRLEKAKEYFAGVPVVSCYDKSIDKITPLDENATSSRHGNYRKNRYTI